MKRILAILLALVMLLSLTACGKDEESTPTGESTGVTTSATESTNDATDGTEDSTQGTTESTTGGDVTEATEPPATTVPTTIPANTTPPATEVSHTHSYSSKVTTAATCGKDGIKTFSCSCGHSYTEKIAATGQHVWGDWKQTVNPTYTAKGQMTRTCGNCSAVDTKEVSQLSLDSVFMSYPQLVESLGRFNSVSDLRPYVIFEWTTRSVASISSNIDWENDRYAHTYSLSALNAHALKYLGVALNGESLVGTHDYGAEITYDATNGQITITYHGAYGDGNPPPTYKHYTVKDDTHFTIHYTTGNDEPATIEVELRNGNYIIVAHKKS